MDESRYSKRYANPPTGFVQQQPAAVTYANEGRSIQVPLPDG